MATRILLLTQWFDPEPTFKGLAFARELVKKGFHVEVVTGFPNYPRGKLYPGYRMRLIQRECIDGVQVTRVPLYLSHDGSAIKRILNYVSFAFSSMIYSLFFAKKPDVIYAYHPPLTTGIAALMMRLFRRVPVVYDIQDMWPESLAATGMLNHPQLLKAVGWFCQLMYRYVNQIVVLSIGFKKQLIERGVPADKIQLIYNWCDEAALATKSEIPIKKIAGEFNFLVMFAGNLGYAQALETMIDAAEKIAQVRSDIGFVLLGTGVAIENIKQLIADKHLLNVELIPPVSMNEVASYLKAADVLMVHLKKDPLFTITIPSKTQAYMAVGKPILMAVQGDAADLIEQAQCGVTIVSEDSEQMMQAIMALADMDSATRNAMAENGKRFYFENLSLEQGVTAFSQLFLDVSKNHAAR